jgi:hypothetical protein
MNRICPLALVRHPGCQSRLEGQIGDVRFIVRRDQGRDDQWLLLATPFAEHLTPTPAAIETPRVLSQRRGAEEAARDIIARFGEAVLEDSIDDFFEEVRR